MPNRIAKENKTIKLLSIGRPGGPGPPGTPGIGGAGEFNASIKVIIRG